MKNYKKREIVKGIHKAFDDIKNECSPSKKTLFGVFPFGDDPTEEILAKRTDNHYCEYNFVDIPKKMTKLPARLKILVLQGEVDPMHSVESAYNQYKHLLAHGKKKTSLTILKGRGHSFGVRTPEAVDILRDWVED